MDNAEFEQAVTDSVATAITATLGSVNAAAKAAGIPYATLDRRLKNGGWTVGELRRLARVTGRKTSDFIPRETRRAAA